MARKNSKAPAQSPGKRGRPKGSKNKNKKEILEIIQRSVYAAYKIEDWDPLIELSLYAAIPYELVPLKDRNGDVVVNKKTGEPHLVESCDLALKMRCAEVVAKYVHPTLKSVELSPATMGERFTLNYQLKVEHGPKQIEGKESEH